MNDFIQRLRNRKLVPWALAAFAFAFALGGGVLWHFGHAVPAAERSIAVLPFENVSGDNADAGFVDGLQEDVLSRLSKVASLRLIAHTSTLPFASHAEILAGIANRLDVALILEGSVHKSGSAVRIDVRLIRAQDNRQLWTETYNRSLDDVSGVTGEVAGGIADRLGVTLTADARTQADKVPTGNPAAADAYLRGLSLLQQGSMTAQLKASTQAFEAAVKADPDFAAAWAQLANGCSQMISLGIDASPERRAAALHAVETAERLQPDALDILAARAWYVLRVQGDNDQAGKRFEVLHVRWPNNVDIMLALSHIVGRQGHPPEADALLAQALTRDPLNAQVHKLSAINARQERRFDASIAQAQAALAIAPGDTEARSMEADALLARGDLAQAAALIGPPPTLPSQETAHPGYFELEHLKRSYVTSIVRLERMLQTPDPGAGPLDTFGVREELADMQRLAGDRVAADANYHRLRDALQDVQKQQGDSTGLLQVIAWTEAGLGNESAALAQVDAVVRATPESKDVIVGRSSLELRVRLLARLGHVKQAIAGLRYLLGVPYDGSAFSTYPITTAILKLDPDFDNLRSDPEFQKLLQGPVAAKAGP